jgi:predicted O-methyltransferase YrrM
MSVREPLRRVVYGVAPRVIVDAYLRRKALRHARSLITLREHDEDPRAWIDELLSSHFFRPLQKRSEILRLAEVVRRLRPRRVCEIGAAGGGTAFLFAHAASDDATIISIDLAFNESRREAVASFARRGQQIVCLQGDSHDAVTLDEVRARLNGQPLDMLYLDGDHSYEGVAMDFKLYAPLVRVGGLVVFHDIVPDYKTRFGIETVSDTGGVPQFWNELKSAGAQVEEIVEDEEQDGFGIGILRWAGAEALSFTNADEHVEV